MWWRKKAKGQSGSFLKPLEPIQFKGEQKMEKCKNCGQSYGNHCCNFNACPSKENTSGWSTTSRFQPEQPKPYLDGVKVGEKKYGVQGWEWEVMQCDGTFFQAEIIFAGSRQREWFDLEGRLKHDQWMGRVLFHQPPQFTLPPKPKKKKKVWDFEITFDNGWKTKMFECETFGQALEENLKIREMPIRSILCIEGSMKEIDA